jgi:hypothetical protein
MYGTVSCMSFEFFDSECAFNAESAIIFSLFLLLNQTFSNRESECSDYHVTVSFCLFFKLDNIV